MSAHTRIVIFALLSLLPILTFSRENTSAVNENFVSKLNPFITASRASIADYLGLPTAREKSQRRDSEHPAMIYPATHNYTHREDMVSTPVTPYQQRMEPTATYNSARRSDSLTVHVRQSRPFAFEFKTNRPSPFKAKYDFTSEQNVKTKDAKNIELIVKLIGKKIFENGQINSKQNKSVKFSGVYLNPKKGREEKSQIEPTNMDVEETENDEPTSTSRISRTSYVNGHAYNMDPLSLYKPSELSDINLLAESEFRFSPTFIQNTATKKKCQESDCQSDKIQTYIIDNELLIKSDADQETNGSQMVINNQSLLDVIPRQLRNKKPFSIILDVYPVKTNIEPVKRYPPPAVTTQATVLKQRPFFYHPNNPHTFYASPQQYFNRVQEYYQTMAKPNGIANVRQRPLAVHPPNYPRHKHPYPIHQNLYPKAGNNTPVQMLIHLNLYPKRQTRYHISGKNRRMNADDSEKLANDYKTNYFHFDLTENDFKNAETTNKSNDFVNLELDFKNMTIEEIKQGYGFVFPGPKLSENP